MYSLIDKRYTLSRGRLLCRVFHIFRREKYLMFCLKCGTAFAEGSKKCSKQYDDSFVFCPDCGERLSPSAPKISKRNALLIVCIAAALLIVGGSIHELSQVKSQKDAIEQSKYDRALQEYLSTPTTGDLTILSDWTTRTSRNYLYIEGTVKNTSSKDVRYYEIGVKFLDRSGNVVDTDWTNGTDLDAGDSQRFEIMHKKDISYSNIRLYIKEVS